MLHGKQDAAERLTLCVSLSLSRSMGVIKIAAAQIFKDGKDDEGNGEVRLANWQFACPSSLFRLLDSMHSRHTDGYLMQTMWTAQLGQDLKALTANGQIISSATTITNYNCFNALPARKRESEIK